MKILSRFLLLLFVCCGIFLLIRHGSSAMNPARPSDMPQDARFLQSGYDVAHLEPRGDWVACGTDSPQQANWCRVTDARGVVVYEGDYLPLRSDRVVPLNQIHVSSSNPDKLWVKGPVEGVPVPVIPLVGGELLVPANERDALADRWNRNPEEMQQP